MASLADLPVKGHPLLRRHLPLATNATMYMPKALVTSLTQRPVDFSNGNWADIRTKETLLTLALPLAITADRLARLQTSVNLPLLSTPSTRLVLCPIMISPSLVATGAQQLPISPALNQPTIAKVPALLTLLHIHLQLELSYS